MIHIKSNIKAYVFEPANKDNIDELETLIVKCTFNNIDHFICGLYHTPKPLCSESYLLSRIDYSSNFMLDNVGTRKRSYFRHSHFKQISKDNPHNLCTSYLFLQPSSHHRINLFPKN